ncbi:MAG: hypothetical protein SGJ07_12860 [Rhodospirillaceae bacterium]|nr:hypothetical protein [Rhodospirillaceae bacterium]
MTDTTRLPLSPERIAYRRRATAVGFGAILLWALLALFIIGLSTGRGDRCRRFSSSP